MTSNRPRRTSYRRYDRLAILDYVASYQHQHDQRSPSQRDIQSALEISAPSVVHTILHRLAREGLLTITTYGRGAGADLRLTPAGWIAVTRWQQGRPAAQSRDEAEPSHPRSRRRSQQEDQAL